jgi:lipopolysaccharide export system permease protein
MLILDRYLLRQFVQIFVICFVSLVGLYIVIDLFGNIDDFLRNAGAHGRLWAIIGEYYGYRSIGFFNQTSGILALIAAMFTVALFQRYNELTALQAAGIAKWRIIRSVVAAVVVISSLAAGNRELVIPSIRDRLSESNNAQNLSGEAGKEMHPISDNKTDILFRGKQIITKWQQIDRPWLAMPEKLNDYGKQFVAASAFYQQADQNHPSGYLLKGVTQPKSLASKTSLALNSETVVFMPHDSPWLNSDECFVASDITFEYMASAADWRMNASLWELIAGLRNPSLRFGADVRVAIHARIVQPFLDVTLLFLGLPLVLSRYNRNLFFAIGLCVVVVVGFYIVVLGCQWLGSSYLISPALGAWLPLIIFVPAAMAMSQPLRE